MSAPSTTPRAAATNSVWSQLEPLLPQISKPIQYVGGELGAVTKDWDSADRALGADVSRRLRGGPAQPGRADPLRGAQRAARHPRRADVRGLAGPGDADAHARRAAVHRRRAPGGARVRRVRHLLLHRAGLHQHAHRDRPGRHPDAGSRPHRRRPGDRGRRARRVQPGADRRLHRRRGARRRRGGGPGDHRDRPGVEGRGLPGRPRRAAAAAGPHRERLRAALLRRRLPAGRPDPAGRAEPGGRAVPGAQAHDDGPGRLAVPEEAPRSAGRDGARAVRGGDLPGLHPGLPVLPGRA